MENGCRVPKPFLCWHNAHRKRHRYPGGAHIVCVVLEYFGLAAAHAVAAVQAFVAGAAAYGNMSAGVAGWGIALHAFGGCIHRVEAAAVLRAGGGAAVCLYGRLGGYRAAEDAYFAELGLAVADGGAFDIPLFVAGVLHFGLVEHMNQVVAAQVFVRQRAEHEIDDRCGGLDIRVIHHA